MSHGHWLKDNKKMSKSLGNVTCPNELLNAYGAESVRTYMLACGPENIDTNFDELRLKQIHNNFIIDQYLNLLNRVTGKKIL